MSNSTDLSRRRLLQYFGLSAVATAVVPDWLLAASEQGSQNQAGPSEPDVECGITALTTELPILSADRPTKVWKFSGELVKGPPGTVQNIPDSYLGPILRLRKGQKVRIRFHNKLPEPCIIHQHGLHVPEKADGHPRHQIGSGQTSVYEFTVLDRAGTYWFHPHTHHRTAEQAYYGLAGLILVTDAEEQSLELPRDEYDVPLVIQDRSFDDQNQLRYIAHRHDRWRGFLGDRVLVNGKLNFVLPLATRAYRLRILNGANSRIYKLTWSDGGPLTVIGTDGGLLETPEVRNYLMLAPGERVDLWADFRGRKVGDEITLRSTAFSGVMPMMGMGGGMMGMGRGMRGGMMGGALPQGAEYPILTVRIVREERDQLTLPRHLSQIERYRPQEAANSRKPRSIHLSMRGMSPQLNGRSFEMTKVAEDEVIPLNTLQVLEFVNQDHRARGMMMAHPMHIHGQQFQVLKRELASGFEQRYASVSQGFVDNGWKDTVLVMPGEKVTILKRFDHYTGLYLYHCHNLEHEDLDMMRNFLVQA
ncbi:MAG: multicopper oxidase domain-containing protein [Candidatus Methylomirabilis oxygeniifera]|uniref:Multicopper oxidase family protein n=1 Tax=Methylomirabilis oxygeniifera TaxID=671143 RepID=D5MF75_METO1|nr:MAG: multicopper oxidase domain-containing protein [Candidatus Methylomirabilis oxyfera]CBE68404.1 Multicopper oxidase family protein [Candidatus Methylomirabilis oxyfera]